MKLTLDLAFDLDNTINQNDCNLITSLLKEILIRNITSSIDITKYFTDLS